MKRWGDVFSGTGTIITSLLSCAACPMCLPIYAGLLSLIGIELIDINEYFIPIMVTFSLLTLGFMAYQIHNHRSPWAPFKLALLAVSGMITCALLGYEYLLYACLATFTGSIIWSKMSHVHEEHGCC